MSWGKAKVTGYSTGNASDPCTYILPSSFSRLALKQPIIFCHGWASSPFGAWDHQIIDPGAPNLTRLIQALVESGYPVVSPNYDGDTWGNATSNTRIGEAYTYLATLGLKSGKAILMSNSMGHVSSCNYAKVNPGNVAALIGTLPLNDLGDLINNHRTLGATEVVSAASTGAQTGLLKSAFTTNDLTSAACTTNGTATVTGWTASSLVSGTDVGKQIVGTDMPAGAVVRTVVSASSFTIGVANAAANATGSHAGTASLTMGGYYSGGFGATYNPATYASATTLPMPQRLYYATDDTVCVPATVTALQTAIGSSICSIVSLGASGGHSDTSIGQVSASDILSWLSSNGL